MAYKLLDYLIIFNDIEFLSQTWVEFLSFTTAFHNLQSIFEFSFTNWNVIFYDLN